MTTYEDQILTDHLYDLIKKKKDKIGHKAQAIGLVQKFPAMPAIVVEPDRRNRSMTGTSQQTLNEYSMIFMVYATHTTAEESQRVCNKVSYCLEQVIMEEFLTNKFNINAHYCLLELNEKGYDIANDRLAKANRLQFVIKNKTQLYIP